MLPAAPGSVPDVERPVIRYCLTAGISVCLYLPQVSGAGVHGTLDLAIRQVEKDRGCRRAGGMAGEMAARWYNPPPAWWMLPVALPRADLGRGLHGLSRKPGPLIQDVVMHHQACLDATSSTRRPYHGPMRRIPIVPIRSAIPCTRNVPVGR